MTTAAGDRRASARGEHGFVTLWMLGLATMLMFLGGLSVDAGRAIEARRSLALVADAAAVAGASGVDVGALRDGVVRLDESRVQRIVRASVSEQGEPDALVSIAVRGSELTVSLRRTVPLTFARAFAARPLVITVSATASAERVPA